MLLPLSVGSSASIIYIHVPLFFLEWEQVQENHSGQYSAAGCPLSKPQHIQHVVFERSYHSQGPGALYTNTELTVHVLCQCLPRAGDAFGETLLLSFSYVSPASACISLTVRVPQRAGASKTGTHDVGQWTLSNSSKKLGPYSNRLSALEHNTNVNFFPFSLIWKKWWGPRKCL